MSLHSWMGLLKSQSVRRRLYYAMGLWPPYFGAGIRISEISPDFRKFKVRMGLRFWNRNYVGTHFGGSLYAMCDPFYMLILMENLGRDFIVWDLASNIQFKKPGRGPVEAVFEVSEMQIHDLKNQLKPGEKTVLSFSADVLSEEGETIATVDKKVYVRRKGDKV